MSTTRSCPRPASWASTTWSWPTPRWPGSAPTWRRSGCGRRCPSPGPPKPSRRSSNWSGTSSHNGHAYQADGSVFFDISTFPDYGQLSHLQPGGDAPHRRRAGRPARRPRQARPARLHALAALGPRRARLGRPLRPRPPRLAHRVLGHGAGRPRPDPRPPRRRDRPDLPPPRERDRPEHVDHRPAAGPALDALGDGRLRRREDEQVAGQPGLRQRPAEGGRSPGHPPGAAPPPLPGRLRMVRHRPRRGQGPAAPAAGGGRLRADPAFTGGADPRPFAERGPGRPRRRPRRPPGPRRPRRPGQRHPLRGRSPRRRPACWSSWPAWSAST